ncbi:MAG: type II toxin-antitoxin system MqsA family antitoxin [Proteobacteria bacterium]|jgi:YgiT-type zinc finger domain-containing protein|nr:type II toxin-antitoxin system MqsA family antitoxin [Pseudomonadota bacterium]
MDCVICKHGTTESGLVTVSLSRGNTVIVVKEVPAEVCANCGEYYLSEEVSKKLLSKANAAVASGAEVEILRYAA